MYSLMIYFAFEQIAFKEEFFISFHSCFLMVPLYFAQGTLDDKIMSAHTECYFRAVKAY